MDSIASLLANRKPNEPPEIRAIKDYVLQNFKQPVNVMVRDRDIVITVHSSALAGTLRMRKIDLARLAGDTDKQFIFRVGQVN